MILRDAGELAVLVDDDAKPYNVDWMNKYRGQGTVVLRPKTVQQVSEIMKYCNKENIAVVPQGGNTGLVGMSHFDANLAKVRKVEVSRCSMKSSCLCKL